MMQDIYKEFDDKDTEVSEFDPRFVFNAVKNGITPMIIAKSNDLYPEGMVTSESYRYVANRRLAEQSGMKFLGINGEQVSIEGKEALAFPGAYTVETDDKGVVRVKGPFIDSKDWLADNKFGKIETVKQVDGVPYQKGSRIVWSYLTPGEVQKNISGGSITERSDLVIDAHKGDVVLNNVNIDGAVEFAAEEGAQLIADGFTVKNAGWEYVNVKPEEMAIVPEDARLRGIKVDKKETTGVIVTQGRVKLGPGINIKGYLVVDNGSGQEIDLGDVLRSQEGALAGSGVSFTGSNIEIENGKRLAVTKDIGSGSFVVSVTAVPALSQGTANYKRGSFQKKDWNEGGIDFNPAALNLKVQRTGKGIQVQFDPAEIQRIKTEGVSGFTPVIINIMPIKSMLPALGLVSVEAATAT
jgi:hypothetical protein